MAWRPEHVVEHQPSINHITAELCGLAACGFYFFCDIWTPGRRRESKTQKESTTVTRRVWTMHAWTQRNSAVPTSYNASQYRQNIHLPTPFDLLRSLPAAKHDFLESRPGGLSVASLGFFEIDDIPNGFEILIVIVSANR
jgi:hypothetical protein